MTDTDQPTGQTKICSRCREDKPLSDFYKSKKERLGVMSHCKACDKEKGKKYYAENSDAVRERSNANKRADPEKHKAQNKRWYENNKDANYKRSKAWRLANPERHREFTKNSAAKNPSASLERNRRRRQTPLGQLENCIRVGFHKGLTKGSKAGRKTFALLGYTSRDLKEHLERLFEPGMSWDNYGHGADCWHVDHIIPLAAHNYETPDDIDFKRAWALSNLRPLWSRDNLSKGAKLICGFFQPSLALAVANDNAPATTTRTA